MKENVFICECRKLSEVIERRKGLEATCSFVSKCISQYEEDAEFAKIIETHTKELMEILNDDYHAFLCADVIISRVYDLEKRINALLKKSRKGIGSGNTTERTRKREKLNKITDEEER